MSPTEGEPRGARRRRLTRRALVFLVPFAYVGGVHLSVAEPPFPGDTSVLERAHFVPGSSVGPPAEGAGWIPRVLPDDWSSWPRNLVERWYRFSLTVEPASREDLAIDVPRLSMNVAVFVNGHPIGDGGRFDEPIARNWNRPQLFRGPEETLAPGGNVIDVRIRSDRPDMGFLGPVAVGRFASLALLHERSWAVRVTALWVFTAIRAIWIVFVERPSRRNRENGPGPRT